MGELVYCVEDALFPQVRCGHVCIGQDKFNVCCSTVETRRVSLLTRYEVVGLQTAELFWLLLISFTRWPDLPAFLDLGRSAGSGRNVAEDVSRLERRIDVALPGDCVRVSTTGW